MRRVWCWCLLMLELLEVQTSECVESDVRSLMAALHSSTVHISVIELATLIAGQWINSEHQTLMGQNHCKRQGEYTATCLQKVENSTVNLKCRVLQLLLRSIIRIWLLAGHQSIPSCPTVVPPSLMINHLERSTRQLKYVSAWEGGLDQSDIEMICTLI